MDIFTTALTKVRAVPIKPEKLRVKSLHKEAAAKPLSEDDEHIEGHQLYFVREKQEDEQQEFAENNENNSTRPEGSNAVESPQVVADEGNLLLHKEDITHPKKEQDKPDQDTPHLDIYI